MTHRIGILGGTFDPIHHGHLAIAEEVRYTLGLERVLLIPTGYQPLKAGRHHASPHQRLAMVALACRNNPLLEPNSIEVERSGPSYTITTLETLTGQLKADYFFILGVDALNELPRWRSAEHVLQLAQIIGVQRPGAALDLEQLEYKLPMLKKRLTLIEGPKLEISSSELRQRVAEGRPIRYLTPDAVIEYISNQRLYQKA